MPRKKKDREKFVKTLERDLAASQTKHRSGSKANKTGFRTSIQLKMGTKDNLKINATDSEERETWLTLTIK
jgi:hypothetical protein